MANDNRTVLALTAHPDDAEFRCGGTLILLKNKGWDVHICTTTAGDCGSAVMTPNEIAITRRKEAQDAAASIGATYHCLGGQDLKVFDDDNFRSLAVALIREVNPICVITHFPQDYMPDHDAASAISRCATFTASIRNYVTGPAASVPPISHIPHLYYFCPMEDVTWLGERVHPHFYVDVSSVIDKKADMLGRHASQREWLRRQHGMDQYVEQMKTWDAEAGAKVGVTHAEGFFAHRGHAYPKSPLIESELSELVVCLQV